MREGMRRVTRTSFRFSLAPPPCAAPRLLVRLSSRAPADRLYAALTVLCACDGHPGGRTMVAIAYGYRVLNPSLTLV